MKITYKPFKRWWQFWKIKRTLKEGIDYETNGKAVMFLKFHFFTEGTLNIEYDYEVKGRFPYVDSSKKVGN